MAFLGITERATATPRRGAKQPDLHARRGERGGVGGDRNVARGNQLATGSGGQTLHLRDDRLGQQANAFHDASASVEYGGIVLGVPVDQLVKIMPRTENRPLGAYDHHAGFGILRNPIQPFFQRRQGAR